MIVIYIRLMLESIDSDCILYYEGFFEDLKTELAIKLDVTEEQIEMTISYFARCGLIQFDEKGNATLPQAEAMLASETNWAKYKREKRAGKIDKLDIVQPVSNLCPTEIEIEIDKEIKSKKYSESERDIYSPVSDETRTAYLAEIKEAVSYLNSKAGTKYRHSADKTQKHIRARLKEGFTVDEIKKVIDIKSDEWLKTDMSKYLRPETLFGSKFESYLNQPEPEKSEYDDLF